MRYVILTLIVVGVFACTIVFIIAVATVGAVYQWITEKRNMRPHATKVFNQYWENRHWTT